MNKYKTQSKEAQTRQKLWQMCERKQFATKEDALQDGMEVYLCPHCRMWHRTSTIMKVVRRPKRRK